jgi:hypothetical protein
MGICDAIRYGEGKKLDTEDGEDGDTPILWNAVVDAWKQYPVIVRSCEVKECIAARRRTFATRLEETSVPLHFSAPPNLMSFPMATSQSTLYEPVATKVIPILDDLVPLPRRLFLGCTADITYTM